MNTTNHTSPSGEDAANGATVKPVASLVTFDEFVQYGKDHGANIVNGMPWSFVFNGHAVTHENDDLYLIGTPSIQFKRGELLVVTAFGEYRLLQVLQLPAANGAIGEREAAIKAALDVLLKVSPKSNYSDYVWIEIRKAREGLSALLTRAALTAEKVAAEPVGFRTRMPGFDWVPWLTDDQATIQKAIKDAHDHGSEGEALYAAPQQPAQSAEQDERAAFDAWCKSIPANRSMGPWEIWQAARAASTQSTATQPVQTQVALTDELLVDLFYAAQSDITKFRIKARTLLTAAQPESGGDRE
jgi:hypothetical protein